MAAGDMVDLVTSAVAASPADDYSATHLCELTGLSFRHLSRLFVSRVGMSPAQYVEQVRLCIACRALRAHAAGTLPEVAASAGFGSTETMRRVFLRHLGTTPGAYRASTADR